ncbi:carboxypeptidase-like regulatory domain-containing protein [Pseudarcicella hirudinis]|uniref:carboxypeptidase-like regulatory domain-containing protein n=1 Tax=Pseudarcicella hirudinis TaxID=1079859 RepID=UPI0035EB00BD
MKITLLNYRKLSSAWLLILCCLLISDPISAQLLATNKFGQVRKKGKNPLLVKEALRELEKKYNITFGYEGQALDNLYVASDLWQQGNDLKTAVNALLSPLKLTYKQIKKDVFVIKLPKVSPAEGMIKDENPALSPEFSGNNPLNQLEARLKAIAFPVKGKVLDDKGESVPGVSVKLKGTSVGTVTDVNGEFSINAPDNKGVLVFSHIGFITKEVAINNKTVFEVTLETNNKELGEVVVVGYGTQEKKDVTGAVSVVKGSDIQNLPSGGAQQALQGRMSGERSEKWRSSGQCRLNPHQRSWNG